MEVGSVLRDARILSGWSQRELARRAGVPLSTVGRIERDAVDPRVGTLAALADALGVDLQLVVVPRLPDWLAEMSGRIVKVCAEYGAHDVVAFGSVAVGRDDPGSDLDLLVSLDATADLLSLVRLERELTRLVGRDVDVVPREAISESVQVGPTVPLVS
jgi:uncharacterized protein